MDRIRKIKLKSLAWEDSSGKVGNRNGAEVYEIVAGKCKNGAMMDVLHSAPVFFSSPSFALCWVCYK